MREEYGQRLKAARLNAGFTQKDVSEQIQRPQQTIAAWEVGRSQPDFDTFAKLLRLYGASAEEILDCGQGQNVQTTKDEYEWIQRYRGLDRHGKEIINCILTMELARVDAEKSDVLLAAARGGGISPVDRLSVEAAINEHVQLKEKFDL